MYDLLSKEFEDLFSLMSCPKPGTGCKVTPHRMRETEDSYSLSVDVPGIPEKNLEISVENGTLHVKGEVGAGDNPAGVRRSLDRSWTLGKSVNQEGISAKLEDGVLYITLPKSKSSMPRSIPISC